MKNKKLHAMVEALINEDIEGASTELHEYLNEAMTKVIEMDDDKSNDEDIDESDPNECTCDEDEDSDEDEDEDSDEYEDR